MALKSLPDRPESSSVPIGWLVGPVIALALVGGVLGLDFAGNFSGGVHGNGGFIMLAFAITAWMALLIEIGAVAVAVSALARIPSLRSFPNFLAVMVGTIPFFLFWWFVRLRGA